MYGASRYKPMCIAMNAILTVLQRSEEDSTLEKFIWVPLQVYGVRDSALCLTGTAEVPLAAVYMDQIIPEEALPIRMAAFGHCFRTEAGAAGAVLRSSGSQAFCLDCRPPCVLGSQEFHSVAIALLDQCRSLHSMACA